jgi:hypothetical protein
MLDIFLGFITFVKLFILGMSILYILKIVFDIAKVYTLQEGKVDMGKYGLLYLLLAISYIFATIFY